jgi:hypothetical protein
LAQEITVTEAEVVDAEEHLRTAMLRSDIEVLDELLAPELIFTNHVAVVSVRMRVAGTYDGNPANGDFRFTRVWALTFENSLRVVAAHAGIAG